MFSSPRWAAINCHSGNIQSITATCFPCSSAGSSLEEEHNREDNLVEVANGKHQARGGNPFRENNVIMILTYFIT